MEKLKVLMLSDCFFPVIGGREMVIHNLMLNLKNKCDIVLGVPKMKLQNKYPDNTLPYKVIRCKGIAFSKSDYLAIADRKFKKYVEDFNPDIIHCHTKYGLSNYAIKYAKKHNIPTVTTVHSNYGGVYPMLIKPKLLAKFAVKRVARVLNSYTSVLTVSKWVNNEIKKIDFHGEGVVVPNATELTFPENYTSYRERINELYGLNDNLPVFCMVGRMVKIKSFDFLIRACKILSDSGKDFRLFMVGDGPDINFFKDVCKDCNLFDKIIFTGMVTDRELLKAYYLRSCAFSFPSVVETSGIVVQEAAALKVPSIVIEKTAPAENITDLENGFVCTFDEKDFANKMAFVIDNLDLAKKCGENASKTVAFSWQKVSDMHFDIYKKLCDK